MFRHSPNLLQTGEYMGNTSRRAYEQNYRENLRMKAAFWNAQGKFTPIPAAKYVYKMFGTSTKLVIGFFVGLYLYSKLVNWSSRTYNNKFDGLMQAREDYLVSTGKLKHAKFLVNPTRQIDDPDANNIPSYTIHEDDYEGKKVFSKSFFDEYYEDDLHEDKAKFKRGATIGMNFGKKQKQLSPEQEEILRKNKEIPILGAAMPPPEYQQQMMMAQQQQQQEQEKEETK